MEPYIASRQDRQLGLDFASSFCYVDRAVEEILAFVKSCKIPIKPFDLNLVLREVLNNAVEHGNQSEFSRRVRCQVRFEADALHISVEDEGYGFDRTHLQPSDIGALRDGGKGLLLMEMFGFDVSYSDRGNIAFLTKSLTSI